VISSSIFLFFFCSTGYLHQPFFQDRVSWTICLCWLWTTILLISASWVAKRYLAQSFLLLSSIPLHIDAPEFVYSFTCWWTFGLFPVLTYYK
jgi:hypothetical protein